MLPRRIVTIALTVSGCLSVLAPAASARTERIAASGQVEIYDVPGGCGVSFFVTFGLHKGATSYTVKTAYADGTPLADGVPPGSGTIVVSDADARKDSGGAKAGSWRGGLYFGSTVGGKLEDRQATCAKIMASAQARGPRIVVALAEFPGPETRKYSISGTVTERCDGCRGRPVAGASVTANGISTITGKNGRYRLDGLEKGRYTVRASFRGALSQPRKRTVRLPRSRSGVDFDTPAGPLQVKLSVKKTTDGLLESPDAFLSVSVTNAGDEAIRDLAVIGRPKAETKKTACPGSPVRIEGTTSTPAIRSLAPGSSTVVAAYPVRYRCAGRASVTVRIAGTTSATRLTGRASASIDVPETAFIEGKVDVVPAWIYGAALDGYGGRLPLPPAEYQKLLKDITIKAKGTKRTLRARINRLGEYRIKIPRKALGRYVLTPASPGQAEVLPARAVAVARAGRTSTRDFEVGYSCSARPPGMKFAPKDGAYEANPDPGGEGALVARYRCRSRRLMLTSKRTVTGGREQCVNRETGAVFELVAERLERLLSLRAGGALADDDPNTSITGHGVFTGPTTLRGDLGGNCVQGVEEQTLSRVGPNR